MTIKSFKSALIIFFIIIASFWLFTNIGYAQLWKAIPPYNVLWPLWSPILSPPDPVTGLPSPLVTTLNESTYLPVQPAMVWDPSLPYFHLLYNQNNVDCFLRVGTYKFFSICSKTASNLSAISNVVRIAEQIINKCSTSDRYNPLVRCFFFGICENRLDFNHDIIGRINPISYVHSRSVIPEI